MLVSRKAHKGQLPLNPSVSPEYLNIVIKECSHIGLVVHEASRILERCE